jgi:LPXTG-site transpeptidase (sortase) family protein
VTAIARYDDDEDFLVTPGEAVAIAAESEPSSPVPVSTPARARELSPGRRAGAVVFVVLAAVCIAVLLEATVISGLQHEAAQSRAYAAFRGALARGVTPLGQVDQQGRLLTLGTSVALLEVPGAGIHEVVGEGTTSGVLMAGPGHSRTSPLPGQAGTSVILGRRSAYGGPFKRLRSLRPGATIRVTTGQGRSQYTVISVRHKGDPVPPPVASGKGRLVLVTASGGPLVPSGLVYVDAELTTPVFPSSARARAVLDASEKPLGTEGRATWSLVLWMQVLLAGTLGAIWAWFRWGRVQTWVVFSPLLLLAAIRAASEFLRLLPNLT